MRTIMICVVLTLTGGALGGFATRAEFLGVNERFEPNNGSGHRDQEQGISEIIRDKGKALEPLDGALVEVIGSETFDFGYMEQNGHGTHVFNLRNTGDRMLKLQSGGTSCQSCTLSKIARSEIPPGESTSVTIDWNVSSPDLDFRKEAYVLTNDPRRPTVILVIKGKVIKSVRVEDEEIRLGAVTASEGREGRSRIYFFREGDVTLSPPRLANPETAAMFDVEVRPLTPEEVASREGAKRGFEVKAVAKPGLPLGTILQTIRLDTSWEDVEKIEIPIRGTVVNDIAVIAGKLFDSTARLFKFDVVSAKEGRKVVAQIAIKGPRRNDVRLTVESVDPPDSLRAELGEPKPAAGGAVTMIPLTVEVPAGSPPVSRMGGANRDQYGRIVIRTTHPEQETLELLVRFAVEGTSE